jgi:hypothetical protein
MDASKGRKHPLESFGKWLKVTSECDGGFLSEGGDLFVRPWALPHATAASPLWACAFLKIAQVREVPLCRP